MRRKSYAHPQNDFALFCNTPDFCGGHIHVVRDWARREEELGTRISLAALAAWSLFTWAVVSHYSDEQCAVGLLRRRIFQDFASIFFEILSLNIKYIRPFADQMALSRAPCQSCSQFTSSNFSLSTSFLA